MATHSFILTWKTEEPGGLQPMGHKELDMTEYGGTSQGQKLLSALEVWGTAESFNPRAPIFWLVKSLALHCLIKSEEKVLLEIFQLISSSSVIFFKLS